MKRVLTTLLKSVCIIALVLCGMDAQAQGNLVTGAVRDAKGEPVIGATVILKGTTIGTATNAMGEYAIDIRQADAVLVYSLIGYNKVELALADNQTQADVTLKSEAIAMDNVVVVGYADWFVDRYCRQLSYYRGTCGGTDHSIFMDCYVTVSAVDASIE